MKKLSFILIAVAAVLNFSCEREQLVETDNTDIWEAEFESDGQDTRTSIDSGNGHVTWNVGDIINFLNGSTEVMRGEVISTENSGRKAVIKTTRLAEGEPVAAFYSGGAGCNPVAIMDGDKMSVSFHIPGVQSGKFEDANISAAVIREGSRSLTFTNLTSVFEFEVTNPAVRQIKVLWGTSRTEGVDATINFNVPLNQIYSSSISASSQIAGLAINLDSPGKYYMSFPMWTFEANSVTIYYYGEGDVELCKVVYPKIIPYGHKLYLWGDVENRTTAKDPVLSGEFSVGETKKIKFSVGNLVATIDASGAPTAWKFAANQYDCLGEGGANKTIGTAAGDVDLFGWSTAANNFGISTSTNNADYSGNFVDWGKDIGDGSTWRTLSKDEWVYLFKTRSNASSLYKTGVSVCGKANCVIIAPDGYTGAIAGSYDSSTWPAAEADGLICLPAAGCRNGSYVRLVGDYGEYWSSAARGSDAAYNVHFLSDGVYPSYYDYRFLGFSVRLVTDATITPPSPSLLEELPNGETFNSYMKQLAGELKNITFIAFVAHVAEPKGDIQIAKDIYMSYTSDSSGNKGIRIETSKYSFKANEDCSFMFDGCDNVTDINGLQNLNTSATTNMCEMFSRCNKLEYVNLTGSFTTANVTNMNDMFWQCEKLETLDLSNFDTRKVTNMGYMFEWCYALKQVFLGSMFLIPDGCFVEEALLGCNVTMYGTSWTMESFQKALKPGNYADYYPNCLRFAIDMGDAGWWSAWNIGAERPTEFGYYYSWGNNKGHWQNGVSDGYNFSKDEYKTTEGYKCDSDWSGTPNYYWFDSFWRVPGKADFEKLLNACNVSRTSVNDVSGTLFHCKATGNEIFLPDTGHLYETGKASETYYWTRETDNCWSNKNMDFNYMPTHFCGVPVRPMAKYGDVAVTGVSISKTSLTLSTGETATLTATVSPSNASVKSVFWTSSNSSVATVSGKGVVTGISDGTTTITATTMDGEKKATCTVTVKKDGLLPGVFSVSATKKVKFSKGNLYWDGSAFYFEAKQYDVQSSWNASHVSHFYWSESASVAYAKEYNDESTSLNEVFFTNATGETAKSDFTVDGLTGQFRTLTVSELIYLLDTRTVNGGTGKEHSFSINITYGGKKGLVLYPDDYNKDPISGTVTELPIGVVFLPEAGYRSGSNFYEFGDSGTYWSASTNDGLYSYRLFFFNEIASPSHIVKRDNGCCVRLVTDIK